MILLWLYIRTRPAQSSTYLVVKWNKNDQVFNISSNYKSEMFGGRPPTPPWRWHEQGCCSWQQAMASSICVNSCCVSGIALKSFAPLVLLFLHVQWGWFMTSDTEWAKCLFVQTKWITSFRNKALLLLSTKNKSELKSHSHIHALL